MVTTLTICQIKVKDMRCHEHVVWTCSKGLNLLIGANGSGKTSLLESVYLMVHGRSFRQARERPGGVSCRALVHVIEVNIELVS